MALRYPGGTPRHRTFTYGELTVPVDTPVILDITSTDVLHSWWVPALGGQVQATPGDVVQTWFKADEIGTYSGHSTIFSAPASRRCGPPSGWSRCPSTRPTSSSSKRTSTAAQGIIADAQKEAAGPVAQAEGAP